MSQQTPTIAADKSGLDYRTEDNAGKKALLNHHKGSSAPSYAEAGCVWLDDSSSPWVLKCHDGTDWIELMDIDTTGNESVPYINGGVLGEVAVEYSKAQNFNATTLTDAATVSWDLESNQVASVTLGGNRTLGAPTNMKNGATYILIVKQDGTGSRTLAYNSAYKFAGGTAPTLTTDANAVDILSFVSDGTSMYGVFSGDFS